MLYIIFLVWLITGSNPADINKFWSHNEKIISARYWNKARELWVTRICEEFFITSPWGSFPESLQQNPHLKAVYVCLY